MFENLSDRLERSFKILKGEGKITEINVAETLKDVRRALLDADVNYKVAKTFTDTVKKKALGMNVLTAVKPSQLMVKIVHDELAELMGGEAAELNLNGRPSIILMSGLQGSGKTTFSGKLANMLKNKQHKNPLLVACDVYRPAAIEQLKVVGEQVGVPVYSEPESKDVVSIANNAIREAKAKSYDVVIVDTAGRLAVDEEMMNEIETLKNAINPDLAAMIPGVGKAIKDVDIDDNAFKGIEAIIKSMTPKERTNPEILNQSRRMRIAKGSGTNIQEVNRLIKQFDQTRKMMKMVTGTNMAKMAGMMSKMKGMPGMPKF